MTKMNLLQRIASSAAIVGTSLFSACGNEDSHKGTSRDPLHRTSNNKPRFVEETINPSIKEFYGRYEIVAHGVSMGKTLSSTLKFDDSWGGVFRLRKFWNERMQGIPNLYVEFNKEELTFIQGEKILKIPITSVRESEKDKEISLEVEKNYNPSREHTHVENGITYLLFARSNSQDYVDSFGYIPQRIVFRKGPRSDKSPKQEDYVIRSIPRDFEKVVEDTYKIDSGYYKRPCVENLYARKVK